MTYATRTLALALTLALMAALVDCVTVRVSQDYDPAADFSGLRTWAWMPGPQPKTGDLRVDSPLINARVRAAVDATLAARGFVPAGDAAPDFRVGYHLSLEQKLSVQTVDTYYGYGRHGRWGGAGTQTYVNQYDEGTLIIDVADARREQLVWRGWGSRRISRSPTPEKTTQVIDDAVARILAQFPPR